MLRAHMSLHMIQPTEPLRIMLAPNVRTEDILRRMHPKVALEVLGVQETAQAGRADVLALVLGFVGAQVVGEVGFGVEAGVAGAAAVAVRAGADLLFGAAGADAG